MFKLVRQHASAPTLISLLALFVALGGGAYAASVAKKNSVTSKSIKNGAITGLDVKSDSITGEDILESSLALPGPSGPEPWQQLPLAAGFSNFGGVFEAAGFRKDATAHRVDLRGALTFSAGVPQFGATVATLPEGYRPAKLQIFIAAAGEGFAPVRLDIAPDGTIKRYFGTVGETDYVSLSGISFFTD